MESTGIFNNSHKGESTDHLVSEVVKIMAQTCCNLNRHVSD